MTLNNLSIKLPIIHSIQKNDYGDQYIHIANTGIDIILDSDSYSIWYHEFEMLITTSLDEVLEFINSLDLNEYRN